MNFWKNLFWSMILHFYGIFFWYVYKWKWSSLLPHIHFTSSSSRYQCVSFWWKHHLVICDVYSTWYLITSSFSISRMQHFWKWILHLELVYTLSWLEHAHFITQSQHGAIYISCTFVGSCMLCGLILIWSKVLKFIAKCFIHPT